MAAGAGGRTGPGIAAICLLAALTSACGKMDVPREAAGGGPADIAVFFDPEACRRVIVEEIGRARRRVWVQAYSFTSREIAEALAAARRRGVEVIVILDAEKADKKSEQRIVHGKGLDLRIDSEHGKAHNKTILIDGETVITGSLNFADRGESAENLLVIKGRPQVIAAYEANFAEHLGHSEKGG